MNEDLTFRGLMLVLARRRAILLRAVFICLALGVLGSIYFFLNPKYRATGQIEVQRSATDGLELENLINTAQVQADALEDNITLQTQASVLKSPSLALKVIKDLNLENTKDFAPTFDPVGQVLGLLTPRGASDPRNASLENAPRRREHVVKVFTKHLKVNPQPGTRLIELQYTSSDPKLAAAAVNALTRELTEYQLNSRSTATSQVSGWLSGQLGDLKKEAELEQGKVERLQRDSGVYSLGITDAQGKEIAYSAILDQLQQDTQDLSTATSNRILKGALYKSVQNGDPELISGLAGSTLAGSSPAVSNSFVLLQNLRAQQATLASEVASDTSKYGEANPRLADDKASLDSINAQISAEVHRIGERAQNDYKAAQLVEDNTRELYNRQRRAADDLNDKNIALLIARQEANDSRTLYQTLYSRLKEGGVIEGLRSSNINVVDAGQVPAKPVPYGLVCLPLSILAGLFFGVCGALFAEATDGRLKEIADVENLLHAPAFAVLPLTHEKTGLFSGSGFTPRLPSSGERSQEFSRPVVLDGPNTAFVEAVRGLRTALLWGEQAPKTVLITSSVEQEGKSTLSLNLAAAMVLNGARVLLVDADLRSAGVSGYMGSRRELSGSASQAPGLSEALSENLEPKVWTPFPELPGLSAITAGGLPKYPAELLGRERLAQLVKSWAELYDYVVIDSPPLLAVADALVLARIADTAILVARHGLSTEKGLQRAYLALNKASRGRVEVIVNGVRRKSASYQEFYGYKSSASSLEA